MYIELPHALVPAADLVPQEAEAADVLQTVTAERAARGTRSESGSRMRVGVARDARQWPAHASVDAGSSFELTYTSRRR